MNRNNAIIVKIIHTGKRFRGIMGLLLAVNCSWSSYSSATVIEG